MTILGRVVSNRFFKSYWVERIAAVLAIVGLAASIQMNFPLRTSRDSASDFKTMYGSIWSMAHGLSAYNFHNIAAVFDANGVIQPERWYGHAPVYPPFTLALMTPLAWLPMVPALTLWFILCAIGLACALAALAEAAGNQFGLSRPWRMVLIAVGAAWPLCSFGLQVENVSVAVAALSILAVVSPGGRYRWLKALGLAVALLLKPHLALWVLLALALLPDRNTRWLAARATGCAIAIGAVICLVLAMQGQLLLQLTDYRAVLHSELASGSMSAGNHELMDISAQILSLDSLVSFFSGLRGVAPALAAVVLAIGAIALAWASLRQHAGRAGRYPVVAAWCAFGMLATYHRAHDGVILLILLPWLLNRLCNSARDLTAWLSFAGLLTMSLTARWETFWWLETKPGLHDLAEFLLYRQAPLGALVVACVLVGSVVLTAWRERVAQPLIAEGVAARRQGAGLGA